MKYTLRTKIGNQDVVAEFDKMSEMHKWNSTYGHLPHKCDACGSVNVFISFKSPGGNDYYTMACGDCGASANFGIHKDGKGLFWKRDKMEKWVPPADPNQEFARSVPPPIPPAGPGLPAESDLPF